MYSSQLNYVPLAWPFFSILVGLFLVLVVLVQVHAIRFAYMRLGISSGTALLLLLGSLLGSYINIPVAHLSEQQMVSDQEMSFFGMRYVVPVVVDWPGTIIAVNVGGAVIPILLSLDLLAKNNLWARGLLATACLGTVCYLLARPVPGVGIAIPTFVPPAVAAVVVFLSGKDKHCRHCLRQWEPRNIDRCGSLQSEQVARNGCSGCLNRRCRHL